MPVGLKPNFCPSATLAANNTFPAPTGPTNSCFFVTFVKTTQSRLARFPSTNSTKYCLSILVLLGRFELPTPDYKTGIFPAKLQEHCFAYLSRIRTYNPSPEPTVYSQPTHPRQPSLLSMPCLGF